MKKKNLRNWKQKGFALLTTTAGMFVIIPVVGLAIDAGFLYGVRARLTAATDAAAIGAARSLSRGLSISEQEASARARARDFFDANFPDGSLNSTGKSVVVTVSESSYRTRTVHVSASVDVGLFFMRVLGRESTLVRAEGQASRRDVNLILVLDRSSSMNASNSCAPMRTAATTFVEHFANERDRLGLITFGATYYEGFAPSKTFKTGSPNLTDQIAAISCSGNTSTAMALSEAYVRLQNINEPGVLNLIVLFTDGLPNGVTAHFPVKQLTDTRYGYSSDGYSNWGSEYSIPPSPCTDADGDSFDRDAGDSEPTYFAPNWNPNWAPGTKLGVLAQWSGFAATGRTAGVLNREAVSITNPNEGAISDRSGCRFGSNRVYVRRDIAYIPDVDYYGNSTRGYKDNETFPAGHVYEGQIRPDTPSSIGSASFNTTDNAAQTIRADDVIDPVIYAIGLGDPNSSEPPDEQLMRRIANDPMSSIYDPDEPPGMYIFAPDNTKLAEAFYRVASEILRISL